MEKVDMPVTLVVLPPKSIYAAAFLTGVALTLAYHFGKKMQRVEPKEK